MQVRAAARVLEKGTQEDLITRTTETRNEEGGRDWKDHSAAWIPVRKPHYNTCLEEILSATGENGEREIPWDFNRDTRNPRAITMLELGTKDTLKVVWDLRIRELEEEGWTVCYSDRSGLENKAAGAFTRSSHTGLHRDRAGSKYLGTRATHFDGELNGIAQALEESREVNLLAILTDSKPAISVIRKLDSGAAPPRSEIEARILHELCKRTHEKLDTGLAWVKGHKGIEGNEKADKLCREASILGHESEGVVTPAGLRAWSKRVRAEARGGNGEGVLGWNRKAISAYTWCVTEKGPQRKWLHKIKKKDTPECQCGQHTTEQSGEHLVERCSLLARERSQVERKELSEWKSRHTRNKIEKKEKGPVGSAKTETEKEEDKLETFFCKIHEFHNPAPVAPVFIPAELPPRYAISFLPAAPVVPVSSIPASSVAPVFVLADSPPVPAVSATVSASPVVPVNASPASTVYSVISSVNFVISGSITTSPSTCIETT